MYEISIIVGIDNAFELTNNFFEHLFNLNEFSSCELIVVVDGDTTTRTVDYLQAKASEYTNFNLHLLPERVGYSKVNNFAVKKSKGQYLLFINSDVFPEIGAIEKLSEFLKNNSSVGLVQGLLLYPQSDLVQSTGHVFGNFFNSHALEGRSKTDKIVQEIQERQGLTSAFYMMERTTFDRNGGFDEFYYNAWDGLDLSLKIHFSGRKCIYYPEALAYHIRGGSRQYIANSESHQTGYFWNRWSQLLSNDLPHLLKLQIPPKVIETKYLLINCSRVPDFTDILNALDLEYSECINIRDRFYGPVNLYLNLTYAIKAFNGKLLFMANSFQDLKGNMRWIKSRNESDDIVLDLKGNFLYLNSIA